MGFQRFLRRAIFLSCFSEYQPCLKRMSMNTEGVAETLEVGDSAMGFLTDGSLCVPIAQMAFLLAILVVCMITARHKLGLLVTFCHVYYWGFLFNRGIFVDVFGNTLRGLLFYLISGFLLVSTSIYAFFFSKHE
jgi:hypothetical protein